MSNFVTTYSTQCGVKSAENAPDFPSSYFPTPSKYITLQSSGGHPARDYPLYSEVCNILVQKFKNLNIDIVQLGAENDSKIDFTIDLRGKTNLRQTAYIIENALLHTGVDSSLSHLAGIKNIPLVTLCPNSHPKAIMPHYCHEKTICVVSDRNGEKFNFDPYDTSIKTIKPETVANAVLELLEIENDSKLKTLFIGDYFSKKKAIDFVPNFPVAPNILKDHKLSCRADLEFNINAINQFFSFYSGTLVLDRTLPREVFDKIKPNVENIFLKLDKGYDKNFVKYIHKSGIKYVLTYIGDETELKNIKLDLFDYNPVYKQSFTKKPVDILDLSSNSIVRTNRSILSKNKIYPSEYHYKNDISYGGEPVTIGNAIDDADFWKNLDHYYLYNI